MQKPTRPPVIYFHSNASHPHAKQNVVRFVIVYSTLDCKSFFTDTGFSSGGPIRMIETNEFLVEFVHHFIVYHVLYTSVRIHVARVWSGRE
jgi:hypothetical protein